MFTRALGRLCGPGFLSLPPPETKLRDASPKQEGPGVVGRPTGWDVQAREGQRPHQGQQVARRRLSTAKGKSTHRGWGVGGVSVGGKDARSW